MFQRKREAEESVPAFTEARGQRTRPGTREGGAHGTSGIRLVEPIPRDRHGNDNH